MANMAGKIHTSKSWVFDTGAMEHMIRNHHLLEDKINCNNEALVVIPNDDYVPVEGKGISTLPNGIKIAKVLYIPKFNYNLLSVSRLIKDLHCYVTFFLISCYTILMDEELYWHESM